MKSTDDKGLIPVIVASEADSNYLRTIPTAQTVAGDGSVSLDLGLPPECATSVAAGGKRPEMKDMNGIWNLFSRAIQSLQAYRGVYDSSFATAIGGYPKNAMVSDSSGTFWVSTADQNVTVPGASGANWQSLFNGYATQAWANGQFLQLALATLQSVIGPVAFGGKTTVPDVSAFTGADALNAKTAEGRYIKSIPVIPNKRITDIWENADGRLVFGDGTAAPVVALLSDLPISDTTKKIQFFTANAVYSSANPYRINFPTSFKPGTTPIVLIANTGELGTAKLWISNVIPSDGTNLLINNEGFSVGGYVIGVGIEKAAKSTNIIPVIAIGEL